MTPALGPQNLRNLGQGAEVHRLSEPGSLFQCSLSFVPHSEELHSAPLEALVDGEMGGEPCPSPMCTDPSTSSAYTQPNTNLSDLFPGRT